MSKVKTASRMHGGSFEVKLTRTLGTIEPSPESRDSAFIAACKLAEEALEPGAEISFPAPEGGEVKIEVTE